jgi:RNA recognition motif-containing protein
MNIYVGNIPFSTTDEDLNRIFSQYGQVHSAKVIMDRETGRSKGFGFVEMNENVARKAMKELNDSEIDGHQISVNEARPKKNNRSTGRSYNRNSW